MYRIDYAESTSLMVTMDAGCCNTSMISHTVTDPVYMLADAAGVLQHPPLALHVTRVQE